MRPRFVAALDGFFNTTAFDRLVPGAASLFAAAMLVTFIVFVRRSNWRGLDRYHAAGMGLWAMLGGLVGARVFYLVQHAQATLADPSQIFSIAGGVASWGAYLGGFAGFALYARWNGVGLWPYADALGSCLGLGPAIGRWGCFLNGDDFGSISNVPWAVRFPHASIPFVFQVRSGLLSPLADWSLPIHPVQIYLSLNGLAIFFFATLFWKRNRSNPGATFWFYVLAYCTTRFLWEFVRGDQVQLIFGLTVPQVMALLVAPLALFALRRASQPSPAHA